MYIPYTTIYYKLAEHSAKTESSKSAKRKKGKRVVNYSLIRSSQSEYQQSQGKCLLRGSLSGVFR